MNLKAEEDKTWLDRNKLGGTTQMFEGCCSRQVLQSAITVEAGEGDPCSSKDRRVIETTEVPKNSNVGIRASSLRKALGSIEAHLHQHTENGQQTGAGSHCTAQKL